MQASCLLPFLDRMAPRKDKSYNTSFVPEEESDEETSPTPPGLFSVHFMQMS